MNATNAGERDEKIAATPLRRIGKPIEVAYGVLFLASDEASFITGTELVIDGALVQIAVTSKNAPGLRHGDFKPQARRSKPQAQLGLERPGAPI